MSAVASGNESGFWTAVLRWAEPLMVKVTLAADDEPEIEALVGMQTAACSMGEEDAERWDGLS